MPTTEAVLPAPSTSHPGLSLPYPPLLTEYSLNEQAETTADKLSVVPVGDLIIFLWLLGVLFCLGRLVLGIVGIVQLSSRASEIKDKSLPAPLRISSVKLKVSSEISTPMTWGVIQPLILLPVQVLNLPTGKLQTILKHELVHIERRDYLIHLLSLIAIALYWFNPLVWFLKTRQVLEREKACDEQLIKSGIPAISYAEQLVDFTRNWTKKEDPFMEPALPLAKVSQTKQRVMAILKFNPKRALPSRKELVRYACFFGCFIPLLAAISPISPAEEIPFVNAFIENLETIEQPKVISTDAAEQDIVSETVSPDLKVQKESINLPALLPKRAIQVVTPLIKPDPWPNVQPVPILKKEKKDLTGAHTSWVSGKSTFRLWVYGDLKTKEKSPYVSFTTSDGMLIVEESRKGIGGVKTFKLMLTPAPFDGRLIQTYAAGKPNSFSSYPKGSILPFWFKNNKWVFLGKGKDAWMAKHMRMIIDHINTLVPVHIVEDPSLYAVIQENQDLKATQFLPALEPYASRMSENESEATDLPTAPSLQNLPLIKLRPSSNSQGKLIKVGRPNPSKWNSGFSGRDKAIGMKFGTIIPYEGSATQVHDINIHIAYGLFKRAKFAVNCYKVEDDTVIGLLNEQPIHFEVDQVEKTWIKHKLEPNQLIIDSDVLITLELINVEGNSRNQGLFLSLGSLNNRSSENRTQPKDWPFWNGSFAFYLTVSD